MPHYRPRRLAISHLKALACATIFVFINTVTLGSAQAQTGQNSSADAEQARAQLKDLEQEIARITAERRTQQREQGRLQNQLRSSEIKLGELRTDIRRSNQDIETLQAELAALESQQQTLQRAAAEQQTAVAQELREAFKRGDDNQLRLLLSEEDPQLIARLLAYYRYVLKARSERLEEYRATIASVIEVQNTQREREAQLQDQAQALARQEQSLESEVAQRQGLLTALDEALKSSAERLAERERDRSELESLLSEIEAALAQLIPDEDVEAFEAARGRMRWPVDGRITRRFGRPRNQGKMRWQGVRLSAKAGTPVNAIHHGRVVYADWFRGMGLLLVLDHGDGYLSLYAHNQSLMRDVGDWVSEGVPIATVGDTGGQSEAALYFEIRKDGKPTDPQRWCQSKS